MKSFNLVILVTIFGITVIQCEPEPMARPIKPRVFTSPEELQKYVDLVKDHYLYNGKARYGKREGVNTLPQHYLGYPWNNLRFLPDIHHNYQQLKEDKSKPITGQVIRNFQDSDLRKEIFLSNPAVNFSDMIDKYYDDTE
ncbi:uncharacterized protein LOC122514199 [Polistes fuscatus]|uniref:uncharacterized protein LOC122514199 n=1 Tax=Polistes fuscatus TaxID=30207 RepID=UPI001CA85EAE|nr:uncharacterized protein LOC122514199 [Polistes fuscatus]